MILTVGGIKGGSGKTTVATHLAIMEASAGRDVLLVDADDQETAADFTRLRNELVPDGPSYTAVRLAGAAVRSEVMRLAKKYDVVVIDTGGRDTTSQRAALTVSQVVLVPLVPRSFDVWTLEPFAALLEQIRLVNPELRAHAFVNRADPRRVSGADDNAEAEAAIAEIQGLELIHAPLGTRKAFGNAAARGQAVTEMRPRDPKAIHEITILHQAVFGTSEDIRRGRAVDNDVDALADAAAKGA